MKIGLDIDGVLANFLGGFIERAQERGLAHHFPSHWKLWTKHYDGDKAAFDKIWAEITEDRGFWKDLAPLCDPETITFPVSAYVTARPCPSEDSAWWLGFYGFPDAPVITVPYGSSKVEPLREAGVHLFIDDNVTNFEQINAAGHTKCLLWDTPVNAGHDAKGLRIRSFQEVEHERRKHSLVSAAAR